MLSSVVLSSVVLHCFVFCAMLSYTCSTVDVVCLPAYTHTPPKPHLSEFQDGKKKKKKTQLNHQLTHPRQSTNIVAMTGLEANPHGFFVTTKPNKTTYVQEAVDKVGK